MTPSIPHIESIHAPPGVAWSWSVVALIGRTDRGRKDLTISSADWEYSTYVLAYDLTEKDVERSLG